MKLSHIILSSFLTLGLFSCSQKPTEELSKREMTIIGRAEFDKERLKDPATGEIPENIRMRELAFASTLPKTLTKTSRESVQMFEPIGPRNVGGRTRAISFHKDLDNVVLAGAVSGGMWRSTDNGASWKRATNFEDHSAVSCIVQDLRPGKTNVFYYGSGESSGNSASKSFSANYQGSGMYKSIDDGASWSLITSTSTEPQKRSIWGYIYNITVDNTRMDKDIIYAATSNGIRRSEDGGDTWTLVLGGTSQASYSFVTMTSTGVLYAHITADGTKPGFWRSTDGTNWVNISPSDLPTNHDRTLIAIAPSNEDMVYYYSVTPGSGISDCSFWKYQYLSGDGTGTGGNWENRSSNLPPDQNTYSGLNTQNTYCMSLIVKPDNEDMVFLGGTNLFRSNTGFANNSGLRQIGGYNADGYNGFDFYKDNQHPDQQSLAFRPQNPNHMLAGTDGGLHFTTNPGASKVLWKSYNNGYYSSQFYGIAIDHLVENETVTGGFQDNGSWRATSSDTSAIWSSMMGGDGAFCAIEGGTNNYYFSYQNGGISRVVLNDNGTVKSRRSATPSGASGYLFVHPYILNPTDNNQMYLPISNSLWRNDDLSGLDIGRKNWTNIATISTSSSITAVAVSENTPGIVYVGTRSQKIFRIVDDGSDVATVTDITTGITSGNYTSNIAVDPNNSNNVLVVYSNYNVISMWSSTDAGATWENIEGNLVGESAPGTPPGLSYLSNGPSFRWAKFVSTDNGNLILLGTSIGLFATNNLDGENTVWVQQASDVIGNVVIEQIDYRKSDGFCVIGTHGAGAYKTYFANNYDITSVNEVAQNPLAIKMYPNPVVTEATIEFTLLNTQSVQINLMNAEGKVIYTNTIGGTEGLNTTSFNLSEYPKGMYFVNLRSDLGSYTKPLVRQ